MNYILSLAFLFLLTIQLNAQQSPHLKYLNESSGYQNTQYITDVFTDQKGYLWVVNFSGINRYDGKVFKPINTETVSHANLLRIKQKKSGELYVIDYLGGIYFIDSDTLRDYPFNSSIKELQKGNGFTDFYIDETDRLHISFRRAGYRIIDKEGNVINPFEGLSFSNSGDVVLFINKNTPFLTVTPPIGKTSKAKMLYLLAGNRKLDSSRIDKNEFSYPASISKIEQGSYVYSSGRGNLWLLSNQRVKRQIQFDKPITKVFSDSTNNIWVSTYGNGLFVCDTTFTFKHALNLIPNSNSIASCSDKESGVWIYSEEKGLVYVPYPNFKYFSKENGMIVQAHVLGLEVLGKKIFVGGQDNVISVLTKKGNYWTTDSVEAPIQKEKAVFDIAFDQVDRQLWISQRGAIYWHGKEGWDTLNMSLIPEFNSGSIARIVKRESKEQDFVLIHDKRYLKIVENQVSFVSETFPSTVHSAVWHRDSLFLNTETGVYLIHEDRVTNLGKQYAKLSKRVYSLNSFGGQVWISIRNEGVHVLSSDSLSPVLHKGEVLRKGAVTLQNDSSLWVVCRQGTFNYKITVSGGIQEHAYARLPQIAAGEIIASSDGIFWGTWNQGLFYTPFEAIRRNPLESVELKLTQIAIDGAEKSTNNRSFQLDYNEGFIRLDYQAISYQDWEVSYRHRMLGLNEKWNQTLERSTQYTTLPPGDYTFELQARKGEQAWSIPIQIEFEILPPIWQRWWFILISVLLTALLIYQVIAYRFRIIQREQNLLIDRLKAEQRALRAQMNPHFVFNILSSVQYLVMKNENKRAVHFLNLFAGLMRKVLDYSNTNLISLEEEIRVLKDYLELEQLRMESGFQFEFKTEGLESHEDCLIPPFLIQPFIENAIHHGLKNKEGEKNLKVSFKAEGEDLKVEVEDDGIGRKAASAYQSRQKKKRRSHGTRIIQERLALHNHTEEGNVEIVDLGTDKNPLGTLSRIKIKMEKHESTDH